MLPFAQGDEMTVVEPELLDALYRPSTLQQEEAVAHVAHARHGEAPHAFAESDSTSAQRQATELILQHPEGRGDVLLPRK